jgi:Reverse transcriptase (RNA-dependent DNA polymerase).
LNDLLDISFTNNFKFASFDITNMYKNIPTQELTDIIYHLCKQNNIDPTTQTEFKKIFDKILTQNCFRVNNIQYSQHQGLAMGAPSPSILSDVYLQLLENPCIYNILIQYQIICYFRYVDDVLIVYSENNTGIHQVLNLFNNIFPTLNFTTEKAQNDNINSLDISIYKTKNLIQHLQKIYRYVHHYPKRFEPTN